MGFRADGACEGVASRRSGRCPYPERKGDEGQQEARRAWGVKCIVSEQAEGRPRRLEPTL